MTNQVLAQELMTAECFVDSFNHIDSITQTNDATGADNAAQTNDFSIAQASDLENNCDEFEEGTNSVFCNHRRSR